MFLAKQLGTIACMIVSAIVAILAVEHLPRTEKTATAVDVVQVPVYAEERIIDLPEDGNTWHTILFLRPNWQANAAERKAHTIWFTESGLISLRQQTHWHVITTDQPEFEKFRSLVNVTPCLLVERANGEVIYRESGPQLGRNNDGLRRAIRREVQRHCPDGKCLPIHPVPVPNEPEPINEIPDIVKKEDPPTQPDRNLGAALAVAAAGLAGGKLLGFRRGL